MSNMVRDIENACIPKSGRKLITNIYQVCAHMTIRHNNPQISKRTIISKIHQNPTPKKNRRLERQKLPKKEVWAQRKGANT